MPGLWGQLRSLGFLSDEEMGKKDDDHKLLKDPPRTPRWQPARVPSRRLFRQLTFLLLIASGVWFVIQNIPLDFSLYSYRPPQYIYPDDPLGYNLNLRATPAPVSKGDDHVSATEERTYNGPVKFLKLAESLHMIAGTRGGMLQNKNVLFVAASLKSASAILPIACEMGMELRSYVHFALMTRSDIDIQELMKINGVDDSCHIILHDARPDYSPKSSDTRLELAVTRAFHHINSYMHPQAIIVDGTEREEPVFLRAVRHQSKILPGSIIELPENAGKRLSWMSKLDSSSLAAWNKISVDILIHAPPSGSGSLIRLLKSLTAADFTAFTIPHLTIELPQQIEGATEKFLETFHWPPAHVQNPGRVQMLSLRHRIPRQRMTEEESSIRFLESFWPTTPKYSHILVLSPQTELSPQFFHYLKYSLLEYRYSTISLMQEWDKRLMGISMTVPHTYINGTKEFTEPQPGRPEDLATSFLWQAPNSNAVLFIGEKWTELHGFVSQVLEVQHAQTTGSPPEMLAEKEASKQFPSWLEHVLRLSRARGYFTFYPSSDTASTVASVHKELYQAPEEYEKTLGEAEKKKDSSSHEELDLSAGSLLDTLDTLPLNGSLVPFNDLPLLSWDGTPTNLAELDGQAREYTLKWRQKVGGCSAKGIQREWIDGSAKDLFCENSSQ